ncbi:MAG: hypothetical protein R2684_09865 [Pyrinomonadaceae bacterium]
MKRTVDRVIRRCIQFDRHTGRAKRFLTKIVSRGVTKFVFVTTNTSFKNIAAVNLTESFNLSKSCVIICAQGSQAT